MTDQQLDTFVHRYPSEGIPIRIVIDFKTAATFGLGLAFGVAVGGLFHSLGRLAYALLAS